MRFSTQSRVGERCALENRLGNRANESIAEYAEKDTSANPENGLADVFFEVEIIKRYAYKRGSTHAAESRCLLREDRIS